MMSKICARGYVKAVYSNGEWGPLEKVFKSPEISLNCLATGIGYSQSCFEGMRAQLMKDKVIRIVSPYENYKRLTYSCRVAGLVPPSKSLFSEALRSGVSMYANDLENSPRGTSLYIRPIVFGSSPGIKMLPAYEFTFIIACALMGNFVEGDASNPASAIILNNRDRVARHGTGGAKLGANYVGTIGMAEEAERRGFKFLLFLDPRDNEYIEEFSTSNFVGIIKPKAPGDKPVYVVPRSPSILESIVNRHLSKLASEKLGWKVENRRVSWKEVAEGAFSEVIAIGTAVSLIQIGSITREYGDPKYDNSDWIEPVYGKIEQPKIDTSKVFRTVKVDFSGAEENFPLSSLLKSIYLDILSGEREDWESYNIMQSLDQIKEAENLP